MKKKLDNFFYYYKFHVLAVIFILFVIYEVFISIHGKDKEIPLVIVDDTSQMSMVKAEELVEDFADSQKIGKNQAAFRYRSMYVEKEQYKDIAFDAAGIKEYQDLFTDGSIDLIIRTADDTEQGGESWKSDHLLLPKDYFTEQEMKKYQDYFYYVDEEAMGITFDKCPKAKEFFRDDYPTEYHYILQIAKGSKEEPLVKKFLVYLMGM